MTPSFSSVPKSQFLNLSDLLAIPPAKPNKAPPIGPPTNIPRIPPPIAPVIALGATSAAFFFKSSKIFLPSVSSSSSLSDLPNRACFHPVSPLRREEVAPVIPLLAFPKRPSFALPSSSVSYSPSSVFLPKSLTLIASFIQLTEERSLPTTVFFISSSLASAIILPSASLYPLPVIILRSP